MYHGKLPGAKETTSICPINIPGQPWVVFPMFVSQEHSHAFRDGGPGLVPDQFTQEWVEPLAVERERATFGFST